MPPANDDAPPVEPVPLAYAESPQPNSLAIASLLFSIFGFIIPILGSLSAIILGFIALRNSRNGRSKGRSLALFGISLGTIGIFIWAIALILPSFGRAREPAQRIKCASNLRQIGQAILLYANENQGQCPARFEDLILTQDIGSEVFTCPSSNDIMAPGATPQAQAQNLSAGHHLSYIYLGAGHALNSSPTAVLAYEPLSNHANAGMNVLYFGGHVAWVPAPQAQQLIRTLNASSSGAKK
jgi:prepilin-type processing-associated H-X9-DG protein